LGIFHGPGNARESYLTPALIAEYDGYFDEAEKAAGDDGALQKRVAVARLPLRYAKLQLHSGTIYTLDAMRIAEETGSRLNMPMMAMLAHVLGFPEDAIKHAIEDTWPRAVKANLAAYEQAVAHSFSRTFAADGRYPLAPPAEVRGKLGYDNMLDGGAIDTAAHSTVGKNNAHVRFNEPPAYARELCIDCAKCLVVCADPGAIHWEDGKMVGIDLTYCKGCMRCVAVCPETKRGKALTNPALKEVEA
ncbi:MAG TPA: 2-oxoacid:acceptor oxidoreductase family protein, partial [Armatimonadota bacterium]|nr:2-oxoacid:acceptor oxidoreductase family protein [Armatimonadota bacterium]